MSLWLLRTRKNERRLYSGPKTSVSRGRRNNSAFSVAASKISRSFFSSVTPVQDVKKCSGFWPRIKSPSVCPRYLSTFVHFGMTGIRNRRVFFLHVRIRTFTTAFTLYAVHCFALGQYLWIWTWNKAPIARNKSDDYKSVIRRRIEWTKSQLKVVGGAYFDAKENSLPKGCEERTSNN